MSKKQIQTQGIANKGQIAIAQNTIVEDNLLPSAEELEKLKQVDPEIISWIMKRAEKEQDARLDFNTEQVNLAKKNLDITNTALWLAFVLSVVILLLGGLFIYLDKMIAGSIFGGLGVFVIVQSFLKFGRR